MSQRVPRGRADEGREVELKLALDPADLARAEEALARRAAKRRRRDHLHSVYFDTKGLALRKAGVTLRVRRIGERRIQTIKLGNGGGAMFDRPEWEREIEGDEPDLLAAKGTAAEPLLAGRAAKVRPVFSVEVRRTAYDVAIAGSRIEAALDHGTIEAKNRSAPVCEIELELKRGERADLFALARALVDEIPVRHRPHAPRPSGATLREASPASRSRRNPPRSARA